MTKRFWLKIDIEINNLLLLTIQLTVDIRDLLITAFAYVGPRTRVVYSDCIFIRHVKICGSNAQISHITMRYFAFNNYISY